jgi:tRNA-2-methylthio-N6-dimethylallyladenosine synthase
MLKRMKRLYTVELYDDMMRRIRETVPDASVSSDFIVGFCGETEAEFAETVELVRWARFKNSFIFKYSPRPGTRAAERFDDDVPEATKRRRNNELLDVQNTVSLEDNAQLVGMRLEVLVEGPSKASRKRASGTGPGGSTQLVGRTAGDRIVVFDAPAELTGRIIQVDIEKADACTLFGRLGER